MKVLTRASIALRAQGAVTAQVPDEVNVAAVELNTWMPAPKRLARVRRGAAVGDHVRGRSACRRDGERDRSWLSVPFVSGSPFARPRPGQGDSRSRVTGPSLTSSTRMCAPK